MPKAISASGERNPNAIRVRTLSLVVRALDEPLAEAVLEGGVDRLAVPTDLAAQLDEGGDAAALRPWAASSMRMMGRAPLHGLEDGT